MKDQVRSLSSINTTAIAAPCASRQVAGIQLADMAHAALVALGYASIVAYGIALGWWIIISSLAKLLRAVCLFIWGHREQIAYGIAFAWAFALVVAEEAWIAGRAAAIWAAKAAVISGYIVRVALA